MNGKEGESAKWEKLREDISYIIYEFLFKFDPNEDFPVCKRTQTREYAYLLLI
jgi:hypothetical protein